MSIHDLTHTSVKTFASLFQRYMPTRYIVYSVTYWTRLLFREQPLNQCHARITIGAGGILYHLIWLVYCEE